MVIFRRFQRGDSRPRGASIRQPRPGGHCNEGVGSGPAQTGPNQVGEAGRPDVSHWANGFAAQRPSIARLRDRLWCGSPD